MPGKSTIEWCDATWNVVSGCAKVSAGCQHCYAETLANRFWGERKFTDVQLHPDRLDWPLHRRKPLRIFVNSMSDLFHESVPDEFIIRTFAAMAQVPRHFFLILTKRPERMPSCLTAEAHLRMTRMFRNFQDYTEPVGPWPLPNVGLGVSVENQATADERIPLLLQTPAAMRFVSAEPLLGPVDFDPEWLDPFHDTDPMYRRTPRLDWIIPGGESGPGARPCNVEWIRSIVEQCAAAGTACFVKQLGSLPFTMCARCEGRGYHHGFGEGGADPDWCSRCGGAQTEFLNLRDRKGGDPLEWPADLKVRQWPKQMEKR